MFMKKILNPLFFILFFFFAGCSSSPAPKPITAETPAAQKPDQQQTIKEDPSGMDEVVAQFDTIAITKKTYQSTKTEMQTVVEELNKITFSHDYERWLTWLSEEYIQTYSNQAFLERASANLPVKGIKLKTLRDYFDYVFVPSRQNMRVDDIQFVSPIRVYVIMEIMPKSPAAIYILEKTSAGWKLVPKNQ
jgi:hypothetical protein